MLHSCATCNFLFKSGKAAQNLKTLWLFGKRNIYKAEIAWLFSRKKNCVSLLCSWLTSNNYFEGHNRCVKDFFFWLCFILLYRLSNFLILKWNQTKSCISFTDVKSSSSYRYEVESLSDMSSFHFSRREKDKITTKTLKARMDWSQSVWFVCLYSKELLGEIEPSLQSVSKRISGRKQLFYCLWWKRWLEKGQWSERDLWPLWKKSSEHSQTISSYNRWHCEV